MTSTTIQLTDSPEVVKLKGEFYRLCEREEALKPEAFTSVNAAIALEDLRKRKREITVLVNKPK